MSGSPEEAKAETIQWKKYSASEYDISFVRLSGVVAVLVWRPLFIEAGVVMAVVVSAFLTLFYCFLSPSPLLFSLPTSIQ